MLNTNPILVALAISTSALQVEAGGINKLNDLLACVEFYNSASAAFLNGTPGRPCDPSSPSGRCISGGYDLRVISGSPKMQLTRTYNICARVGVGQIGTVFGSCQLPIGLSDTFYQDYGIDAVLGRKIDGVLPSSQQISADFRTDGGACIRQWHNIRDLVEQSKKPKVLNLN